MPQASPTPWTVHTNTEGKGMKGEAYIRCADEEDDILGDIVADVLEEADAFYIVEKVNNIYAGSKRTRRMEDLLTLAKEMLLDLYNNERDRDSDVVWDMQNEISEFLEE